MRRVIFVAVSFVTSVFAMTSEQLVVVLDHSVRQSVRSQKMVKEALLIKMDIDAKKNAKRLSKTVGWLESDLNAFLGRGEQAHLEGDTKTKLPAVTDPEILSKIKDFQALWLETKKRVEPIYKSGKASKEEIDFLANNNHNLLLKSRAVVLAITKLAKKPDSRLKYVNDVKYSGKMKMLSQMISKDILMLLNKIDEDEAKTELNQAIAEVDKIYNALFNGDKSIGCKGTTFPPIVNRLKKSFKSWQEAKAMAKEVLNSQQIDKEKVSQMIAKFDKARVLMRKAGVFYEKSISRQKQNIALNTIVDSFVAKKSNSKHIVNMAGRQRMLTQKVAKLAIECSNKLVNSSCLEMLNSVKEYNKIFRGFRKGDKDMHIDMLTSAKAKDKLSKIKEIWNPFAINIIKLSKSEGKDKKALKEILDNNQKLLEESNSLVKIISKDEFKSMTQLDKMMIKIVNIAGKERMLSQKMTKEYLQLHILNQVDVKSNLQKSIEKFDVVLNLLLSGNATLKLPKVSNLEIKKQILLVKKIWDKLKPLYLKDKLSDKKLSLLLKANPILLQQMDKAVKMIDKTTNY